MKLTPSPLEILGWSLSLASIALILSGHSSWIWLTMFFAGVAFGRDDRAVVKQKERQS